jgi:hypothetical protein
MATRTTIRGLRSRLASCCCPHCGSGRVRMGRFGRRALAGQSRAELRADHPAERSPLADAAARAARWCSPSAARLLARAPDVVTRLKGRRARARGCSGPPRLLRARDGGPRAGLADGPPRVRPRPRPPRARLDPSHRGPAGSDRRRRAPLRDRHPAGRRPDGGELRGDAHRRGRRDPGALRAGHAWRAGGRPPGGAWGFRPCPSACCEASALGADEPRQDDGQVPQRATHAGPGRASTPQAGTRTTSRTASTAAPAVAAAVAAAGCPLPSIAGVAQSVATRTPVEKRRRRKGSAAAA